ncbi:hypothetical protein EII29_00145 [Leptotrichia sp. OH3620_COT-345]|uniref:hypothetical protein n=1 Tax=Leptotrichia sp. OH3620_COT-345 TaxID=2491048 RepID=UPI000F64EEF7|nr:hypothetical protein [Leptotrichia sp. OH3620_COT-345]RRD40898.1 hypothetical protein EII29_00145 [Leptotrichia sp. OH3620_COT-345]
MKKNKKMGLWSTVIWNLTLFGIVIILFIYFLLRYINKGLNTPEEYIFLIVIGLFIIANINPTFKNIKKIYLYYKEEREEIFICECSFMKMYQKLSLRRMFLALILPLAMILATLLTFLIFANQIFSRREMLHSWTFIFSIIPKDFFMVIIILSFFLFLKIYLIQKYNIELLFKIYDTATQEEIEILDSIQEKRHGYVFTKNFLINWDGFLNIIPLKEIKEIKYIKYFYLVVYGTRLRIKSDKKYTIWAHGPSEDEWIERGFLSPQKKSGKSINMDINIPM